MSFFSDAPSSFSEVGETSARSSLNYPLPETLSRHHIHKTLILWPEDDEDPTISEQQSNFLNWWKLSAAAKAIANKEEKYKIQMHWGSVKGNLSSHFIEAAAVNNGLPKLICKRCNAVMVNPRPRNQGNQGMKTHLQSKQCLAAAAQDHGTEENRLIKGWNIQRVRNQSLHVYYALLTRMSVNKTRYAQKSTPDFNVESYHNAIVDTVLGLNLSFRAVENPAFRDLINLLRPGTEIPKRTMTTSLLNSRFKHIHNDLLAGWNGESKISLSVDNWSSPNHHAFMAVTAYYITNNWTYQTALIDFIPLVKAHTGVYMARQLMRTIKQLKIQRHFLALATDSASNNTTLADSLEERLGREKVSWSAKTMHIPCFAHIINLAVQALLRGMNASPQNQSLATETANEEVLPEGTSLKVTLDKVRGILFQVHNVLL